MSLLFPDNIQIGLGSTYATLGVLKGKQVDSFQFQHLPFDSAAEYPWQSSLALLRSWLVALDSRKAHVSLHLSAELAVLHCLPWRSELAQPEQQRLIAINHWQRVYGAIAADWDIQISDTGYGQPWLASGVDARLLQELQGLMAEFGHKIKSVQAVTLSLFNRLRRQCKGGDYCFVVKEPQRINAIYIQHNRLALYRTLPLDAALIGGLDQCLSRESRLAGLPEVNARLYVVDSLSVNSDPSFKLSDNAVTVQSGHQLAKTHFHSAQAYLLGAT